MKTIGLLAGIGRLPVNFLHELQRQGHRVVVIAVVPDVDPALSRDADIYYEIPVWKLNQVISTLVREGVVEVTMLGKVTKEILFQRWALPDWRALKLLKRLHDRKDDTIMLALVAELEKDGLSVLDQTLYLQNLMPKEGVLTKTSPTDAEWEDIRYGFQVAKALGKLDIGQTVIVARQAVMALEAIEGTDACIRRGCALARRGAVVVKTAKPQQDLRFDVPAVGEETVLSMKEHHGRVLAIEAGHTLVVDQDQLIRLAEAQGVTLCAVSEESLR